MDKKTWNLIYKKIKETGIDFKTIEKIEFDGDDIYIWQKGRIGNSGYINIAE